MASRCWRAVACRVLPMHLELAVKSGATLGHALGMAEVLHEREVEAANVLFCFACGAFGIHETSASA